MPELTITRDIHATVADVWNVFTDLSAAAQRLTAVERIELLTPGPFGAGTEWEETRRIHGKLATDRMLVTELEPNQSYTVAAGADGARYELRYDFTTLDADTTRVTFTFVLKREGPKQVVATIFWPLVKGRMAKDIGRDLKDLASHC